VEILKESQNIQVGYKTAVRQKMNRQVKIIDPSLSEAQVEEICNDPEVRNPLYEKISRI